MREYYTPCEVGKLLGTTSTMVRLAILQRAPGWETVPYFMCGRNMKIPCKPFDKWFGGQHGRSLRVKLQAVKDEREQARISPLPQEIKKVRVKTVRAKRSTAV